MSSCNCCDVEELTADIPEFLIEMACSVCERRGTRNVPDVSLCRWGNFEVVFVGEVAGW